MGLVDELKRGVILFDGATGTMLQRAGLKGSECPEEWNLKRKEVVKDVHRAYVDIGSQVVTTNTFGANRVKLKEYGLEDRVEEINVRAIEIAREAAAGKAYVAASVGPTGRFIEPVGDLTFDEALEIFTEQGKAIKRGGADLVIIETMMDIKEVKAAIIAMKDATGLPVFVTMTFEENMRSLLGTTPEVFAIVASSLGVSALGANCSLGMEGICRAVKKMREVVDLPLIAQANAGIPTIKDRETCFPDTPEDMARWVPELLEVGVRVIGGCCGTTPEHMKRIAREVDRCVKEGRDRAVYNPVKGSFLASRTSYVVFGSGMPPLVVGERINPTGRKTLSREIREGKTTIIRKEAKGQVEAGAHLLDVNVGLPGLDESPFMKKAIFAINENVRVPIVIDSSSPEAIEEGLKAVDGKALVNSVSGEEKKLSRILPLVKRYGAAVIGLTMDEKGIPSKGEERFEIAKRIMERALDHGISREDIIIDCLALTVGTMPESPAETLKAIRLVKERLGLSTILGVSNISFGLPKREVINASFLAMAIEAGLDLAIINPYNPVVLDTYYASMLLKGLDPGAERYIKRFKEEGKEAGPGKKVTEEGVKQRLFRAIVEGEKEGVEALVEEALKEGWKPLKISNEILIPGLEEVGRRFEKNIYFLPQVMLSAETTKRAFDILKREMKGVRGPRIGKVLLATVEGDVHDIGKNIVATLLENHGFEVIDLGKNVPAERILQEALTHRVDVVGLSALMTTTVMEMEKVIKLLKEKGVKTFTIVGGAVVTQEFADRIGADIYAEDAMDAVRKLKRLLERKGA